MCIHRVLRRTGDKSVTEDSEASEILNFFNI